MSVRRVTMDFHVRSMFQGPHSDGPRHDSTVVGPKVSGGSEFWYLFICFQIRRVLNVWVRVRTKGLTE